MIILDLLPIVDAVAERGWIVVDNALSPTLVAGLCEALPTRWQPAGVGRAQQHQTNAQIRRDQIHWLEASAGGAVAEYLAMMEQLRQCANRELMLGLFDYEAHFARYQPGDFYGCHRDAFAGRSNRRLTTVCYLNEQWQPSDGGILRLYDDDEQFLADIEPKSGRLVVFLSEQFPHEVLAAERERFSIAGWFRVNGNQSGRLDPPR